MSGRDPQILEWKTSLRVVDAMPRMVIFDMDDTLALTKSSISDEMTQRFEKLLERTSVCVISGSRFEQFQAQILNHLEADESRLGNLHLMPTCGTKYYRREMGSWFEVYSEELTEIERKKAMAVLAEAVRTLGYWEPRIWGERIEDRGSQVTFSALGQFGPPELKAEWDRDGSKKRKMRDYVAEKLPGLEVRSGGTTSIDITKKGIDKAYGVKKLLEVTSLAKSDMLFVGDSFATHGNDHPVLSVGVRCVSVKNHFETEAVIDQLLGVSDAQ